MVIYTDKRYTGIEDLDIVAQFVHCQGSFDSPIGFALQKRYKNLYKEYHGLCKLARFQDSIMGICQIVEGSTYDGGFRLIANMFTEYATKEHGYGTINYRALKTALTHLKITCEKLLFATKDDMWRIAIPYGMSADVSTDEWETIDAAIHDVFDDVPCIEVYIFKGLTAEMERYIERMKRAALEAEEDEDDEENE